MAVFSYKAKNQSGESIEGSREARDRFDLAAFLRAKGYVLLSYRESAPQERRLKFLFPFRRVSTEEKMMFARNLAVMINAGLSLTRALGILERQTANPRWRATLSSIENAIRKGQTLHAGMEQHPRIFNLFFRGMVRAGEMSGKLEESLQLVARQLERSRDVQKKVQGALIYPAIIILAMAGVGVLMLLYVVPPLADTFAELGVPLPLTTRFIVAFSASLVTNSALILAGFGAAFVVALWVMQNAASRRVIDRMLITIPVVGPVIKKTNTAQVARALSSLLGSGVEIIQALQITEGIARNQHFRRVLRDARFAIQKGGTISAAFLEDTSIYPILVGEMIAVGEETGKLTDMLLQLAEFFEEEVAAATKNIFSAIEPMLMIVIGVAVGFFAIAMIRPLYNITEGF